MAKTQEMNAVVIAVEEIKNLVDSTPTKPPPSFVGKTFLPITMPRDLIESPAAAAVHAWRFGPTHLHSRWERRKTDMQAVQAQK